MGDSNWGWKYNLPKIPGEILQGISDNIPLCCVFYYTLVKLFCLIIHGPLNTTLKPTKKQPLGAYGWTPDLWVFSCLYKGVITEFIPHETIKSEDFRKLQYWRCPLCQTIGRKEMLNWNSGLYWED